MERVTGHAGLHGYFKLAMCLGVHAKDLSDRDHADRFIGHLLVKFRRNLLINGSDSMN